MHRLSHLRQFALEDFVKLKVLFTSCFEIQFIIPASESKLRDHRVKVLAFQALGRIYTMDLLMLMKFLKAQQYRMKEAQVEIIQVASTNFVMGL